MRIGQLIRGLVSASAAAIPSRGRRSHQDPWRQPQPALVKQNEAAATLAWSFREMLKYRSRRGEMSPWNELGWYIAEELSNSASTRYGNTAQFLERPLEDHCRYSDAMIMAPRLLNEIGDPVLTALWQIGTLHAISDLLAHLVLRSEEPGHLRWNTADYILSRHGVNLYAINDAYLQARRDEGKSNADA
ncbi:MULTISPECIES: hypothetical protein [unclassified Burkholderia]|uniref:hypothetical protein n=1 Tax=unclassified Burkholderia TaxID=2613784 RepID=UPI002AB30389|nr:MULTISPECIES: hypothetical protein [unclassified Burkholderia]